MKNDQSHRISEMAFTYMFEISFRYQKNIIKSSLKLTYYTLYTCQFAGRYYACACIHKLILQLQVYSSNEIVIINIFKIFMLLYINEPMFDMFVGFFTYYVHKINGGSEFHILHNINSLYIPLANHLIESPITSSQIPIRNIYFIVLFSSPQGMHSVSFCDRRMSGV